MTTHPGSRPAPQNKQAEDILEALSHLFGHHPGFRAVHAKGLIATGVFTATPHAAGLSVAPHLNRPSVPVTVRLSDFAGLPTVADNDLAISGPRGLAVRFQLGEHQHTDIVAHSADGFPAQNGEEFLAFVQAILASPPAAAKPTKLDLYLAEHPAALRFAALPKPIPSSFAREAFFAVSAIKFTNQHGVSRFGRYRIRPVAGTEYLTAEEAAKKSPNFLSEEFSERIARSPIRFGVFVQLAEAGDSVTDATVNWPTDRKELELGTINLETRVNELEPEMHKLIFDPVPRVQGLEASDDPLWQLRADAYLVSGRRRRAAHAAGN